MAKILLVEDDTRLAQQVADYLEMQHHKAEMVHDGSEASELLRLAAFDLIVLDWELPGMTGIEILKHYRQSGGRTPVLMLTGKDELESIETGLDTGADDYLIKPFAMRELAARVRALTRKTAGQYAEVIRFGPLEIDVNAHRVTRDGAEIKLQPQEFALLEFLLKHRNEVFSVEALQQRLWASDSEASPHSVRVCITRLRNKIDPPDAPSMIRTVHRVGYQIENTYDN